MLFSSLSLVVIDIHVGIYAILSVWAKVCVVNSIRFHICKGSTPSCHAT
jgi:hypothetical protein